MRFKKSLLLLSLISYLYANEITTDNFLNLDTLNKKEKSLEKDFYIWQYLNENSPNYQEVIDALGQSSYVNNELFFKYAEVLGHDETEAVSSCMQADAKSLIETYSDCIKAGLTINKALSLLPLELDLAIQKTEKEYPFFAKELKILNSSIPFTKIVSSNKDIIYDIYLNSNNDFLFKKLNYKLPKRTLGKIKNDSRFELLLAKVISNPKLNFLQGTFLNIDDVNLSSNASFLLAMNRVLNKKLDEKTINYLDNSYTKSSDKEEKEKILFWKYQILKDINYLTILSESQDINIYTIFAKQYLKKEINFTSLDKTPLNEYISNCSIKRKIMINSFAKSVSNFNKDKIKFLNLGIFQINLKEASKIADENDFIFDYNKLLNIKDSLLYFGIKINELEAEFINPLFIYYSYIDGKDKFQKSLKKGLFDINNPLDPFLSLEIYENKKTKESAKKFLVSYYIYSKYYNKKEILFEEFFKTLIKPLDYLDF